MRIFKLIDHNLLRWQRTYDYTARTWTNNEVIPGIKVCSSAKLQNIAIITDVGPKQKRYPASPEEHVLRVEVLWLTGPHAGKKEWKKSETVVNFDSYKGAISRHLHEIEDYELQADMVGR